jgi:para-nitrobenzyl esterase
MKTIALLLTVSGAIASANDVTVQTSFGPLIGTTGNGPLGGANSFKGIPYAPEPTRFEVPSQWTASYGAEGRSAKSAGSQCAEGSTGSEDCLYMNIWTPTSATPASALPILFFIHGGYAGEDVNSYDGAGFSAAHNVIVATINYRLGPLGFLSTYEGNTLSGNFGMADQREAMRWIKREAVNFGGNPNQIMIVGESPGDMSVLHHTISPKSAGLFQRVLGEFGTPRSNSEEYGRGISAMLGAALGCDQTGDALKACLAAKPLAELLNVGSDGRWAPVVGANDELPARTEQVLRDFEHYQDQDFIPATANVVNMFNNPTAALRTAVDGNLQ